MHQQGAIEGELVNALLTLQIVPAIASRELLLGPRFLGHLEEQQKRQLGDVLVIRDAIVAQDMAEVPKPGNDVLSGGHAASPSVLSVTALRCCLMPLPATWPRRGRAECRRVVPEKFG